MKPGNIVGETMTKFLMATSCATNDELIAVTEFIDRQLLGKRDLSYVDTFMVSARLFLKQTLRARGQMEH